MQYSRTPLTATAILAVLSAFALLGVGSRTAPAHAASTASAGSAVLASPDVVREGATERATVAEDDNAAPDSTSPGTVGTVPSSALAPSAVHRHAIAAQNAVVLPRPDVVTAGRAPPA